MSMIMFMDCAYKDVLVAYLYMGGARADKCFGTDLLSPFIRSRAWLLFMSGYVSCENAVWVCLHTCLLRVYICTAQYRRMLNPFCAFIVITLH